MNPVEYFGEEISKMAAEHGGVMTELNQVIFESQEDLESFAHDVAYLRDMMGLEVDITRL